MMISGIEQVAPIAVMIMFAILYFGIMIDTGLFDPMVSRILKLVKGDPLKIVVGTAVLTMLVALDGDGSTTYMITTSAIAFVYHARNPSDYFSGNRRCRHGYHEHDTMGRRDAACGECARR